MSDPNSKNSNDEKVSLWKCRDIGISSCRGNRLVLQRAYYMVQWSFIIGQSNMKPCFVARDGGEEAIKGQSAKKLEAIYLRCQDNILQFNQQKGCVHATI